MPSAPGAAGVRRFASGDKDYVTLGAVIKEKTLTEALEQQAASSEILKVISGSPADVQLALEAIAGRAMRLCRVMRTGVNVPYWPSAPQRQGK